MSTVTKLPVWIARRGYSASLKRRLALVARRRRPAPAGRPEPPVSGTVIPFPVSRTRRSPRPPVEDCVVLAFRRPIGR